MKTRIRSEDKSGAPQAPESVDSLDALLLDKRYRIVRLLGEGGMGSVHLAEHVGLGKRVAVKFLHLELAGQEELVRRFEQEARVAASIRHKNIIEVYDVGVSPGGDPFLVMEYLEGESLSSLMKRNGPMDVGAACGILEPALLALQVTHRKGIIHRDLKPENMFLAHQPDEPVVLKIIDFGLSKIATGAMDPSRTRTGSFLGTPAYMSPEQARGAADVDHRTDLYAIGTILFEMLTGELPYVGESFNEFFANLLTGQPREPRDVYPAFPVAAEPIVRKAIRRDPEERFQSAGEMLEALKTLSGYERREEHLRILSSSLAQSTFAAGDLGPRATRTRRWGTRAFALTQESADARSASRPKVYPATTVIDDGRSQFDQAPRRPRRALVVGFVVAGIGCAVAGGVLLGRWGTRQSLPAPTLAPGPASQPAQRPRAGQPGVDDRAPAAQEAATLPSNAAVTPSEAKAVTLPSGAAPFHPTQADRKTPAAKPKVHRSGKLVRRSARGINISEQFE